MGDFHVAAAERLYVSNHGRRQISVTGAINPPVVAGRIRARTVQVDPRRALAVHVQVIRANRQVLAQAGVKLSVSVIGRELDLGIVFVRVELKIPVRVFAEEDGGVKPRTSRSCSTVDSGPLAIS